MAKATGNRNEGKTVLDSEKDADGFTKLGGGKFAPFAILDVGDKIVGEVVAVREQKREKKNKKGRVTAEEWQIMLDIKLAAPCVAWNKSEANGGERITHEVGTVVCFPSKTVVDGRLVEAVTKKTGAVLDKDEEGENVEIRAEFLQPVVGETFKILREPDRAIKKGLWQGKMAHSYDVGWKEPSK